LDPAVSERKYQRVAAHVRGQIADGMLSPGEPAPSGASLARMTGYSQLTCRKAIRTLIQEGALVPGPSPGARPRVSSRGPAPGAQNQANAARVLSAALASRRRAAGLTQPQLAEIAGMSVTSIGHAETGRLWQSRRFWELVDKGLHAGGELLALHDAYRAAAVPADPASVPEDAEVTADRSGRCLSACGSGNDHLGGWHGHHRLLTRDSRAASRHHPRQLSARVSSRVPDAATNAVEKEGRDRPVWLGKPVWPDPVRGAGAPLSSGAPAAGLAN